MKNLSFNTWVLVYDGEKIIGIIEPGLNTETKYSLKEFDTRKELDLFVLENRLTYETNNQI